MRAPDVVASLRAGDWAGEISLFTVGLLEHEKVHGFSSRSTDEPNGVPCPRVPYRGLPQGLRVARTLRLESQAERVARFRDVASRVSPPHEL